MPMPTSRLSGRCACAIFRSWLTRARRCQTFTCGGEGLTQMSVYSHEISRWMSGLSSIQSSHQPAHVGESAAEVGAEGISTTHRVGYHRPAREIPSACLPQPTDPSSAATINHTPPSQPRKDLRRLGERSEAKHARHAASRLASLRETCRSGLACQSAAPRPIRTLTAAVPIPIKRAKPWRVRVCIGTRRLEHFVWTSRVKTHHRKI